MNKTKKVAWHKHLKAQRKAKDKARALHAAQTRAAARVGASGTHAQPPAARAAARHTAPRQP
jgi:hypothetical protein